MADSFDKQLAAANVYAVALFDLAREAGQIDEVRAELEELAKLSGAVDDPGMRAFFVSAALDNERRAALLEKTLRGRLSDLTLNTLLVMNANGRTGLIDALLRDYVIQLETAAGQVEAVATTAVELGDAEKSAIRATAAELSGLKPLVDFKVDPKIVGGLILQIGDLRYDNSIQSQLDTAREQLLERSERGIDVGVTE